MQLVSAFAPAVIGGIGSLIGGKQSSDAEKKAAQLDLTGYNYLYNNSANRDVQNAKMSNQIGQTGAIANQTGALGAQGGALDAQGRALTGQAGTTAAGTALLTGAGSPDQQAAFKNYLDSTGYKFALDQGTQALTGSAAARGVLNSGATAKALSAYGQGLAGQSFNNYLGQLNTNAAAQGDVAKGYATQGAGYGTQAAGFNDQATTYGNNVKLGLDAANQVGALGSSGGAEAGKQTAAAGDSSGTATAQAAKLLAAGATNYFGGK